MGLGSEYKSTGKPISRKGGTDDVKYLKPLALVSPAKVNIAWLAGCPVGTGEDMIGELINAVSIAKGLVSYGFNSTEGVNVTICLGGARETYNFPDVASYFANAQVLCDMVIAYCESREPRRLTAAQEAGKA